MLGYNYRLNDIQSALGTSQLKNLNKWIKIRNHLANLYIKKFKDLPLSCQKVGTGIKSAYHLFVIIVKSNKKKKTRNELYKYLKAKKIITNVHYIPIHKQPFFKKFNFKSVNYKNAEHYYKNCLSIPMYAGLTKRSQTKIINSIISFFK